jgi:hypothetical protein
MTLSAVARVLEGEVVSSGVSVPGPGHTKRDRSLRVFVDSQAPHAPRYSARLHSPDGEVIVESSPTPFFAAARLLRARGMIGQIELWDTQRPFPRTRGDIAAMAGLTVIETDEAGPYIARHMPFPAERRNSRTGDDDGNYNSTLPALDDNREGTEGTIDERRHDRLC